MAKELISHAELLRVLDYSPETGVFTWKISPSAKARVQIGAGAGRKSKGDYCQIKVNCRAYMAHRLAWFYVNGVWPAGDLDHIDTDKSNNAIGNLRPATGAQNCANKSLIKTNTTGFKGVRLREDGSWEAATEAGGQYRSLGRYRTKEAAAEAYLADLQKIHGDYARAA